MEITDELRLAILALWHKAQEKDVDSYCEFLRTTAEKIGLPYNELTRLVFDKEYLFFATLPKIEQIDREIADLQKQIDALRLQKELLGHMICQMHGHTIRKYDAFSDTQYCVMCGKSIRIDKINNFLIKRDKLEKGFYPKR